MSPAPLLVTVMGPTASGKSAVAESLADHLQAQLINADAFQMYRGMNVGTATPAQPERYHLLNTLDPRQRYGVGQYVREAAELLPTLFESGRNVVVVGGTGLYIRALTEGFSEMSGPPNAATLAAVEELFEAGGLPAILAELDRRAPETLVDRQNPVRVKRAILKLDADPLPPVSIPSFIIRKLAVVPEISETDRRIAQRIYEMEQNGWIEEVEQLKLAGYQLHDPGFRAIGYSELWRVLAGEMTLDLALEQIRVATRKYAKRQRTWLRSEPNLTVLDSTKMSEADVRKAAITMLQ